MRTATFSSRLGDEREIHPLTALLGELRNSNTSVLDLTASNPTTAGISYDTDTIRSAFATDEILTYTPDPRGLQAVRRLVAEHYSGLGCAVSADQVHLTASSSEAYSWLFKLLADPGDEVLSPRPAYPLFSDLAALDGVHLRPYSMKWSDGEGWRLDTLSLELAISDRTRAVLAVHPANPTGAYLCREDLRYLVHFCADNGLALIIDEVFFDYSIRSESDNVPALALDGQRLTFALGGYSKLLGLPQMKLGWIITSGDSALMLEAQERLDHIADTYLSVGAPVQAAAEALYSTRIRLQEQVRDRCVSNLAFLRRLVAGHHVLTLLTPEGGWSAVLRIGSDLRDEDAVLALLRDRQVLVYPGSFFDFPFGEHLVLSLLTAPDVFSEGVRRIVEYIR